MNERSDLGVKKKKKKENERGEYCRVERKKKEKSIGE